MRAEADRIPDWSVPGSPVIIATGPLTSEGLSTQIASVVGADHLYFFDAISPIVLRDSLDLDRIFRASRWDRSLGPGGEDGNSALGDGAGQGDYLNCPLDQAEYEAFYDAVIHAESATVHDFDRERFFEGCLPIEVLAHRGPDTLRFGPMKPVGLMDPRTGRQPYAVVQLRQDSLAGDHFSLVGFQTQLKQGEQARVLRLVPGLGRAEFARFGMVHRNTYINGPAVLTGTWQVHDRPGLFLAGQISGVEGYVESAASGLLAGLNAAAVASGQSPRVAPRTTAIGALAHYVSHAASANYQPSNITFGIIEPLARAPRNALKRRLAISERALADLAAWAASGRSGGHNL
jgi:methylenetetrahydrofolate--tRNA-(uracil-5-)-methyltransferase